MVDVLTEETVVERFLFGGMCVCAVGWDDARGDVSTWMHELFGWQELRYRKPDAVGGMCGWG
jgi:hypothetical protein